MLLRMLSVCAAACGVASSAVAQLTADDVRQVITQAASRARQISPGSVIAVTDREGYVLGVWSVSGGEPGALETSVAVGKAGTAAYLSSNDHAFTTRTAGFIIQQHFPPGVRNRPPGPLVGVGFSNLPFSDVNRFKKPDFIPTSSSPGTLGSPIPLTSLNGIPGGVPLYKNNILVGGVGVTGSPIDLNTDTGIGTSPSGVEFPPTTFIDGPTKDEDIALSGQRGYRPRAEIEGSNVFIDGISVPYERSGTSLPGKLTLSGNAAAEFPIIDAPPPFPYPLATFGGVQGQIRQAIMADPLPGTIHGQPRLTQAEVEAIIADAADRVRTTRAGIRLPVGTRMEVFITVVNNPNIPGVGPTVLGAFRTGDATIFSWDVAVQKARTAVAFSDNTRAFSTRTVGFLAQSNYPPGIDDEGPGPLNRRQEVASGFDPDRLPVLLPKPDAPAALTPPFTPPFAQFPNGITIFPGGFPLYRDGVLIGAIGISGDGVDQDDIVGASGTERFLAPFAIRGDRFGLEGTRFPYAKFPRDPEGFDRISPFVIPGVFPFSFELAKLANISMRLNVGSGEKLVIGGFIVEGTEPKRVVVRALGPSLGHAGVANALGDPLLELKDAAGNNVAQNASWGESQREELLAIGLAPNEPSEAALVQTLAPGVYTASVTAQEGGSGVGLLEIYDVDPAANSRLVNISSRGHVGHADDVMIGGFIVSGSTGFMKLMVRGVGPSLSAAHVAEPLRNPALAVRNGNGEVVAVNDDWRESQATEIEASALAPASDVEAASILAVGPGAYTTVLQDNGGSVGVGVLEVYKIK